jgi:putative ABC transport system permease protein
MRALNRKLLRELFRLKGQIFTIALVIASGITSFVALRGTYTSLEESRATYYDRYRFAHVFVRVKRAPETLAARAERLPGVALVQTRVVEEVTLPLEGLARPAYGRLLSLPSSGQPATNALCLVGGRLPQLGHDEEVVLLKAFAEAHDLKPGHVVPTIINGKLRKLRIVGIALSPEFVYAIRPGAIVDDPKRYAVLWMNRTALASAFQMSGGFNELSLRLQPQASEPSVIAALDRLLVAHGSDGAHGRRQQISHRILSDELNQLATLSAMIPMVFLGVAAFLVNLVLGRLIRLQRHELATLKAVGYTNREVRWHYLGLVVVVMIPGMLLGLLGGWGLGRLVMNAYGAVFRLPDLRFVLSPSLLLVAVLVSTTSAGAGALLAVRAATRLPPAEAMRPPAPARYRRSVLDRLGLASLLGPSLMMIVREILRRPLRTLFSSMGIAGAVALLILGRFGWDSVSYYFDSVFRREQRQDLTVFFAQATAPRAVGELQRWPGVLRAEGLRAVPVHARHEQRVRTSVLLGLPTEHSLKGLLSRDGNLSSLPEQGVLITKTLGEVLALELGDRIELQLLEGDRRTVHPPVTGFLDEATGLQIYAPQELVTALSGDHGAVSSVLLRVDPRELTNVERRLRLSPRVIDVSDALGDMQRMRDMNASFIDIWTVVSIALSASVIFGVSYNNARIALAARSRDLASLRVLGYSRGEVGKVLLGGLAVEVAIAIPLGLVLGRIWAEQFMRMSLDPETFRWSTTVAGRTYFMAAAVAVAAALASGLWVRRSLNKLDLIGVLKTRE